MAVEIDKRGLPNNAGLMYDRKPLSGPRVPLTPGPIDTYKPIPVEGKYGPYFQKNFFEDQRHFANVYNTLIVDLSPNGIIQASGKEFAYGCPFGRDTFITTIMMLDAYTQLGDERILDITKKSLLNILTFQGTEVNIENGEEPGKMPHEIRLENYDRLVGEEIKRGGKPWAIHQKHKGVVNYDSIDSTPLMLLAVHKYFAVTKDKDFLKQVLPNVTAGLEWMKKYGDKDGDGFLEYELPKDRKHGGLTVQNWTDSGAFNQRADGTMPPYPIKPVEVQAFAWAAKKKWADVFTNELSADGYNEYGLQLNQEAAYTKQEFNKRFLTKIGKYTFPVKGLDGNGDQMPTPTVNQLLIAWASYTNEKTGESDIILDQKYWNDLADRGFERDMFHPAIGVRTMSAFSPTFNPNRDSYHNGPGWPWTIEATAKGMETILRPDKARMARGVNVNVLRQFGGRPNELQNEEHGIIVNFQNDQQEGCLDQAWSAAAYALSLLHIYGPGIAYTSVPIDYGLSRLKKGDLAEVGGGD